MWLKKQVREMLVALAAGFLLAAAFFWAVMNDPYEPPVPEEKMIQAIGGDYYYPAGQYNQYLAERQAYIDAEQQEAQELMDLIRMAQEGVD